jgi:hypothetical protein
MLNSQALLRGFLRLCVAAACLTGTIAAYRWCLHPLITSALSLDGQILSVARSPRPDLDPAGDRGTDIPGHPFGILEESIGTGAAVAVSATIFSLVPLEER